MSKHVHVAPALQSQFDDHVAAWSNCSCCPLSATRRKVVHYRGSLPCDVLFIGEAPGESEDSLGVPFIGPAGHLLAVMYKQAIFQACHPDTPDDAVVLQQDHPSFGITNIVACIPRNPSGCGTGEIRTPQKDEAAACLPRLLEILAMATPKCIITLGDIAKRFGSKALAVTKDIHLRGRMFHLIHPARILHLQEESPNQASLLEKKFVIALSTILKGLK